MKRKRKYKSNYKISWRNQHTNRRGVCSCHPCGLQEAWQIARALNEERPGMVFAVTR